MNGSVSDNIGMLATMINSLVLAENLNNIECETKVFSALSCSKIMNDFTHHDVNE
jgi:uridylate kinase